MGGDGLVMGLHARSQGGCGRRRYVEAAGVVDGIAAGEREREGESGGGGGGGGLYRSSIASRLRAIAFWHASTESNSTNASPTVTVTVTTFQCKSDLAMWLEFGPR